VALLTGLYPAKLGAHSGISGIDHEIVTLPDLLGEHGYTSYMIGKWHAGDDHQESRPEYQGFDHWFGFISQLFLEGPQISGNYTRRRPTYLNPWLENEKGEIQGYPGHLTDILTDHAIKVIETEDNPWFIYLPYYAVHTPIEPSDKYLDLFSHDQAGRYQALKSQLDSNVARIIELLETTGKLQNTMVIIVSDNGGTAASWPSNLPYYGGKSTYSEGGVRTPLLLWWPGRWPEGEVRDQVAMIFDLYPTIAAALDIPVPAGLDGADLFAPPQPRELRWYTHAGNFDTASMLSSNGDFRLSTWRGVSDSLVAESDFTDEQPKDRTAEYPDIATRMKQSMSQWVRSVTRITQLEKSMEGTWATYTGSSFRRTPLSGARTMGFVFQRGIDQGIVGPQLLATQEGYIEISEAGGILQVSVDGNRVELALPGNQDCFSLIVSSTMVKNNMAIFTTPGQPSRTQVYLNGERVVDSEYRNLSLTKASPRNPLRVQVSPYQQWYMPETADVFLSTRVVGDAEILSEVGPELGAACAGASI